MARIPTGLHAATLHAELSALGELYSRIDNEDLDDGEDVEVLRRRWLLSNRIQLPSQHRVSTASAYFACYIRKLADEPPPGSTASGGKEIDGVALITAGVITSNTLTPRSYKQTELVDTFDAIKANWVAACACTGIDLFVAMLIHRMAQLASFAWVETTLDDGRYAIATEHGTSECVARMDFVLEAECFFRDALIQLALADCLQPASMFLDDSLGTVDEVGRIANSTLFDCVITYANIGWFQQHWEILLAPGERDLYHRRCPNLRDDARSILASLRGAAISMVPDCTEDTMRLVEDPRSALALCGRYWDKGVLDLTDIALPFDGPSLRIVCGNLVFVDTGPNVFDGPPYEVITLFLQRTGHKIDTRKIASVATDVGVRRAFTLQN